jgi:TQXA domain-containing protein/LPXTG-motif cell wall-anchored protein
VFGPRNGKRSWAVRAAVVAGAVGALVVGAASTASAQDTKPAAASSTLTYDHSWEVTLNDASASKDPSTPVVEFSLDINGKATIAYCTDLHHPSDTNGQYNEGDWKDAKAKDLGREQWILTNSFPNLSLTDVLANAKVDSTGLVGDQELTKVVYSATQAALWHFSDGFELSDKKTTDNHAPSDTEFKDIQALYSWLIGNAKTESAPPPTLSFTAPGVTSGAIGSKIGPFTVNTTAKSLALTADNGAKLVDKDGNAVTSLGNGGQFFVQPAKSGTTTVTASGTATVPTGRVFFAVKNPDGHQDIILGGSGETPVKATTTVTTNTASPTPSASASGVGAGSTLPVTGTSLTWIIVAAVVLLGGGAGLFVLSRRRRTQ